MSKINRVADESADKLVWQHVLKFAIRFQQFHLYEPRHSVRERREDSFRQGLINCVPGRIRCRTDADAVQVRLCVDAFDNEPRPRGETFLDVVEISYLSLEGLLSIATWPDRIVGELPPLPAMRQTFRLRYHRCMPLGQDCEPGLEAGYLQIWPSEYRPASDLKISSTTGRFWNRPRASLSSPEMGGSTEPSVHLD